MPDVVMFGTPTCPWCRQATKYFEENRVPFEEVNVERDPAAARDVQRKTGQAGVSVIEIGASPTSASTSPPSSASWCVRAAYEPRGTRLGAKDEARRWPRTLLRSGCPVPGVVAFGAAGAMVSPGSVTLR